MRDRCPRCKRRHFEDDDRLGVSGRIGLAVIVVLVAASAGYNLTRETGPPAEFEAMHSAEAAVEQCRYGIESELADREAWAVGPLNPEYLGGGEYEVRGPVTLSEGGRRHTADALCEVRFRSEGGWRVSDVELGA